MSHCPQSVAREMCCALNSTVEDHTRCLTHAGPFSTPVSVPRVSRFDEVNFRTPNAPAYPSFFRNENIQLPPRKMARFSQSMSSQIKYYQSSNMPQGNFGPSTSHGITFRNINEPIITSDEVFEIFLDVHEYKPDELSVKIVDNFLKIDAEHEERMDGISLISQQYCRRYELPQELDRNKITCLISSDGILCIFGPMINMKKDINLPIIPVNGPIEQEAKKNLKELEQKLLESLQEDHSLITPPALTNTQDAEEPTLQQPEVVPENQEEEHVPEDNGQDIDTEQNIN